MKAGVAISPDTPSTAITDEIANAADMLLVMTVYPGDGTHSCFPGTHI
jgi:ribulose-phosphate 3-epimerase